MPTDKPWTKLSKAGYLTEQHSATPGPGIWIRSDRVPGDFQHTIEWVAQNGTVLPPRHCYCGQHRHNAFQRAKSLL